MYILKNETLETQWYHTLNIKIVYFKKWNVRNSMIPHYVLYDDDDLLEVKISMKVKMKCVLMRLYPG